MSPLRSALILFFCISLHCHLHAQSNVKEGYYINLKGDTVFGKFVDYADNVHTPLKVQFQPSSGPATELSPETCRKFSVKNYDNYISYTGKRLLNATEFALAGINTDDNYEDIVVFLRELFNDGHDKLYELVDKQRTNFYISNGEGPLTELYFKEYKVNDSIRSSDVFKRQLLAFFSDKLQKDPLQSRNIENLHYGAKDIVDLFVQLTGQKPQTNRKSFPTQIFIGAGLSVNMFNVSGDPNSTSSEVGSYGSQTTPVFEAGVKVYAQRNEGRIFFMGRLRYYKFRNEKDFHYNTNVFSYNTTYSASVISIPVSVGYKLVTGDLISVEPAAGIALGILSNNKQTKVSSTGGSYAPPGENFVFTPFGELAFTINKITNRLSFAFDYYIPTNIANSTAYSSDHSSFTFGIRYVVF